MPIHLPKRHLRLTLRAWRALLQRVNGGKTCFVADRIAYSIRGRCYSGLLRIQNSAYLDAIASTTPIAPIFVLGFWRSGTTLLHELLCSDERFGFANTHACLNVSHFLLSSDWMKGHVQQLGARPMDNMRFSWLSPQEDEFALLCLGAPSPYEVLIAPSLMGKPVQLLDLNSRTKEEQEAWKRHFDYLLRVLTIHQRKRLVLKSPTHGFRFSLLQTLFPDARYIIIERNPYEVFASNLRLWKALLSRYAIEEFEEDLIAEFVLLAYKLHEDAIRKGLSAKGGLAATTIVRYEELVTSPHKTLARVYSDLQVGCLEKALPAIDTYLENRKEHTVAPFDLSEAQCQRVTAEWGEIVSGKGYSCRANRDDSRLRRP